MTCARVGRQVPIAAEQTLLEAAEDAHVPVDSLCRAGVCGTCRVKVVSGETNCASETLDPQDQEGGYVLACVTTAQSDCTVDL
jgi:ferredoxin